jgi:hypothetical protein
MDVTCSGKCERVARHPAGLTNQTEASCCKACDNDPACGVWIYGSNNPGLGDCYLLTGRNVDGVKEQQHARTLGSKIPITPRPPPTPPMDYFIAHKLQARGIAAANAVSNPLTLTVGGSSWSWSVSDPARY